MRACPLRALFLRRNHQLDLEQVEATIEQLAEKMVDKLGGSWCWQGSTAVCEMRGAKARIDYDEQSICLDVKLPLVLKPLRGRLEGKIEEYFERYFGTE